MSVEGVLARGREAALQLMRDTCIIERRTAHSALNTTTGQYTDTWTTVYSGPCRVKPPGDRGAGSGRDVTTGEGEVTLHKYELDLPWDASPEVIRQDRATVTACDDTWVLGRRMEVVDVGYSGTSTSRRIAIEDRS